jgi:hypothetical protein
VLASQDLDLLSSIQRGVGSCTKGGVWRTIKAPLSRLRWSPIAKHGFGNSGFCDVADQ